LISALVGFTAGYVQNSAVERGRGRERGITDQEGGEEVEEEGGNQIKGEGKGGAENQSELNQFKNNSKASQSVVAWPGAVRRPTSL
jgi:hypothetical protein